MPTANFNPNVKDGFTTNNVAETWASTVTDANGTGATNGTTQNSGFAAILGGNGFICIRPQWGFNLGTGTIPAGSTIASGTLQLFVTGNSGGPGNVTYDNGAGVGSTLVGSTVADFTADIVVGDYSKVGAVSYGNRLNSEIDTETSAAPAYVTWTLTAAAITAAQTALDALAYFGVAGRNSIDLTPSTPIGDNRIVTAWADSANPPILSLTYTLPASGDGGKGATKRKQMALLRLP